MQKNYVQEILNIIHSGMPQAEMAEKLSDYHEKDLADALKALTPAERQALYSILSVDAVAEIFTYLDDAEPYLKELPSNEAAKVISNMDSDDAVDVLEDLDDTDKDEIVNKLDKDSVDDVKMLLSYDEDEIGSRMTTNYISIKNDMTIRQAMSELVKQAGENDNISTLYVVDENEHFYGAIDLKDLIIARAEESLESLIVRSYPYVTDREQVSDCIDRIVDYAERSLPVLNDAGKLVGIITSSDVVELVDDEMGDDYAKLGGLTGEEDLNESVFESVKKRLPWLIALLFLGMLVSSVVGAFESVVAVLPVVICFQSMVLDMAGNVGTQSLAVTIRVLVDENLTLSKKLQLLWKETRVGLLNGAILAVMALGFLGCYIHFFKRFRAVDVFRLGVVHHAPAKGNDVAAQVKDGGHDTLPEQAVDAPGLAALKQTAGVQLLLVVAFIPQKLVESLSIVGGIPQPEPDDGLVVQPAPPPVGPRLPCFLHRGVQAGMEKPCCLLVHREDPAAHPAGLIVLLRLGHSGAGCQHLDGFRVVVLIFLVKVMASPPAPQPKQ